jgi:hypothetical protein
MLELDKDKFPMAFLRWSEEIRKVLSSISISKEGDNNFDGEIVSGQTSAVIGNDIEIPHTLGRVPIGYIVIEQKAPGFIYSGAAVNTTSKCFFRSSAATIQFKAIIF